MQQKKTDIFNRRVTVFSFVLTVLVIWIHAVDPENASGAAAVSGSIQAWTESLLGSCLGQIAVPGFFFMSGYLFFRNCDTAAMNKPEEYLHFFAGKWKTRVKTVLIPYIIWNLIYYAIYLAAGKAGTGAGYLFDAVVRYKYNPVFWYLYQLIIITVLTPLIFLLLRFRIPAAAVLAAVFLSAVYYLLIPVHIVNEDALFYYMTGAALALHFRRYETDGRILRIAAVVCAAGFAACELIYIYGTPAVIMYGIIGGRLFGPLGVFAVVSIFMNKMSEPAEIPEFMKYNFFIYAVHYLEIRFFRAAAGMPAGGTISSPAATVLYILMPALCITAAVIAGKMIKKMLPAVYGVLTGGRV